MTPAEEAAAAEQAAAATAVPGNDGGPATDIDTRANELAIATGQDPEAVRAVLAALEAQNGEDVGVVRFDPITKTIAHRVMDGDIVKWRLSHPTDGMSYEMRPSKSSWPLVPMPVAAPAVPSS